MYYMVLNTGMLDWLKNAKCAAVEMSNFMNAVKASPMWNFPI